jgi:hypothetical protein
MAPTFRFSLVPMLPPTERRGIGFLEDSSDPHLDARVVFDALSLKIDRQVRSRFSYWIDGGSPNDRWFHGWTDAEYRHCFVFKWDDKRLHHRLYGFLCNPKAADRRFQLCALSYHSSKTEWETDYTILDRVNLLRENQAALAAIVGALAKPAGGGG